MEKAGFGSGVNKLLRVEVNWFSSGGGGGEGG